MKIVATAYGVPAIALKTVESDQRAPGPGEVAVAVRAAGVNPKDVKLYASRSYASARGVADSFPMDLGVEASGTVVALGAHASGPAGPIEVGDEVVAYRISGAYADRIVVDGSNIVPKPPQLSWAQAGSFMLVATTAYHTLAAVRARPGQTLLLLGATGNVARYVAQLAALMGVNIIGSASARGLSRLAELKFRPVLSGPGLEERVRGEAPTGIDAAIDVSGADEELDAALALVSDRSRIVTVVAFERANADGFQALGGEEGHDEAGRDIRRNARLTVAAFAQAGALNVKVDTVLPLAQAAKAHELLMNGGGGKIVLTP